MKCLTPISSHLVRPSWAEAVGESLSQHSRVPNFYFNQSTENIGLYVMYLISWISYMTKSSVTGAVPDTEKTTNGCWMNKRLQKKQCQLSSLRTTVLLSFMAKYFSRAHFTWIVLEINGVSFLLVEFSLLRRNAVPLSGSTILTVQVQCTRNPRRSVKAELHIQQV
jgi:hypothetical protein